MQNLKRRSFISKSSLAIGSLGLLAAPLTHASPFNQDGDSENENVFGPRKGYSPQISILVSMMDWMRGAVLRTVDGMSRRDLDYLHDKKSNTIGAMLYHLAATEKYYQYNTFDGLAWGSWDSKIANEWDPAMDLGDKGRELIKGNDLEFYLDRLNSVRDETLEKLKAKDDQWLLSTDQGWGWGPTNNYCKWFHVVEHESNHNGQMKYIKSRIA